MRREKNIGRHLLERRFLLSQGLPRPIQLEHFATNDSLPLTSLNKTNASVHAVKKVTSGSFLSGQFQDVCFSQNVDFFFFSRRPGREWANEGTNFQQTETLILAIGCTIRTTAV